MNRDYKIRNVLNLAQRVQVIKEYETKTPKTNFQALALKYGVSDRQIKNILQNQEAILKAYQQEIQQEETHKRKQEESPTSTKCKHRFSLSFAKCVQVIQEYKSHHPPPTFYALAAKYKVSTGQIRNILLNQETILKAYDEDRECESESDSEYESLKSKEREDKLDILNKVVYEYLLRAVYHNEYESFQQLQIKADEVKKSLDLKNFGPTYIWLKDFKKAHGIKDYSAASLRAEITFTEAKSSRTDVADLLKYIRSQEKRKAALDAQKDDATGNAAEIEPLNIERLILPENEDDPPQSNENNGPNASDSNIATSPLGVERRYRKRAKGTETEKQLSTKGKPQIIYQFVDDNEDFRNIQLGKKNDYIVYKLNNDNEDLASTTGAKSSPQLSDEDSNLVTIYKIVDEGVVTNAVDDKCCEFNSKPPLVVSGAISEIKPDVSCENSDAKIIYTQNTATTTNSLHNNNFSDIENDVPHIDLEASSVDMPIVKVESNNSEFLSNPVDNEINRRNSTLAENGDPSQPKEIRGTKEDEIITKTELSSPLHVKDIPNPAVHKCSPPLLSTADQVQIKIEKSPTLLKENEPFTYEATTNAPPPMSELPRGRGQDLSTEGQRPNELTLSAAPSSTQLDKDVKSTLVASVKGATSSNHKNATEDYCSRTSASSTRKRQHSSSPLPEVNSLDEVLKHLKVVEDYAMLKENYRAIGLVTQLEALLKKASK